MSLFYGQLVEISLNLKLISPKINIKIHEGFKTQMKFFPVVCSILFSPDMVSRNTKPFYIV